MPQVPSSWTDLGFYTFLLCPTCSNDYLVNNISTSFYKHLICLFFFYVLFWVFFDWILAFVYWLSLECQNLPFLSKLHLFAFLLLATLLFGWFDELHFPRLFIGSSIIGGVRQWGVRGAATVRGVLRVWLGWVPERPEGVFKGGQFGATHDLFG